MLGLISRCCQIYARKGKEKRNTNEFNLKQTTLRRITECLCIATRISVVTLYGSQRRGEIQIQVTRQRVNVTLQLAREQIMDLC